LDKGELSEDRDEDRDEYTSENIQLKNVLYKVFANPNLDKGKLGELIDIIGNINLHSKDNKNDILYMRKWYLYWNEIVQQAVAQFQKETLFQIPWGHHIAIMTKEKENKRAIFYIKKTIENHTLERLEYD